MSNPISYNSSRNSDWNYLPSDLWVEIFSHLNVSTVSQMASVCKKFREVVNNSKLLWQKLALRNFNTIHISKENLIKDARFLTDLKQEKGKMSSVQVLKKENCHVSAIGFHKGNLITGTKENFVIYWKNDGSVWKSVDAVKLEDEVISFFCTEDKLFAGSLDGKVNLLYLSSYANSKNQGILKKEHTFLPFVKADDQLQATGVHTIFFEDSHLFCAADSGMKIYKNKKGEWEKPLTLDHSGILTTFSYKNGTLYCGNDVGVISVFKMEADQWVQTFSLGLHTNFVVNKISCQGDYIVSTGEDGFIKRWGSNIITRTYINGDKELIESFECFESIEVESNPMLGLSYPSNVIVFPDTYILTLSTDSYIHIYSREDDGFTKSHYANDDDGLITILSYNLGQIFTCNDLGETSVWEVDIVPNQTNKKLKTNS